MLKEHIPADLISELMGPDGLINILPLVPVTELHVAIQYIRSKFNEKTIVEGKEKDYTSKFDLFWSYFEKVWMRDYDSNLWNISSIIASGQLEELVNRTNNALERYNRHLHEHFSTPHPNMVFFATVIRQEANAYVTTVEDIKKQRKARLVHTLQPLFIIPQDYYEFVRIE
jgi:hypothetical protein